MDPQGIIIYITSFRNLAFKTFQYHIEAFDYIVKDADKTDRSVAECLKAVIERLREESSDNSACYTFRSGDVIHHIPQDDILYFETSSRSHLLSCGERSSGSSLWEIYQTLRMNWENDSLRSIAPMWSR